MNNKSLECYQRFTAGWVNEILVAEGEGRRNLKAEVADIWLLYRFRTILQHLTGQQLQNDERKAPTDFGHIRQVWWVGESSATLLRSCGQLKLVFGCESP